MLSLEMAKKLKSAGLKWEPKQDDRVYCNEPGFIGKTGTICQAGYPFLGTRVNIALDDNSIAVFDSRKLINAPRLDQILAEIEARGYGWGIDGLGYCQLFRSGYMVKVVRADSPEEAAAQALLWIMEQDK
jgi:hypothetical protein